MILKINTVSQYDKRLAVEEGRRQRAEGSPKGFPSVRAEGAIAEGF